MSEFVLTPAERALLQALDALHVRYLLVGMGAALVEGAHGTTQDLDLWFGSNDFRAVEEAARRAGGFHTSGMGLQPPAIGGEGLDRVDVVLSAQGLDSFEAEYSRAREYDLDGLRVRVLPLERVIASKRAASAKDLAQLALLEAALAARRAGEPRFTKDLRAWVEPAPGNAERVLAGRPQDLLDVGLLLGHGGADR